MIRNILSWFETVLTTGDADSGAQTHSLQIAAAALMMEVARADADKCGIELAEILLILEREFAFSQSELRNLVSTSETASEEANDLFAFTNVINQHYQYPEKVRLLKYLWQIAYVDGRLDQFEEHIIRRIADLLHIAHHDFVRQRITAREEKGKQKAEGKEEG